MNGSKRSKWNKVNRLGLRQLTAVANIIKVEIRIDNFFYVQLTVFIVSVADKNPLANLVPSIQ